MDIDRWFKKRIVRVVYALFLVIVSITMINPYRFGVHDHWYMLPWIKNLMDPGLLAMDPVMAQRDHFYSVLYWMMARSPLSLELSFFITYLLCIAFLLYMSMSIHKLFSKVRIYLPPLFLIVPWLTPGGTFTIADHLLMRTAGLAVLMVALYFWLQRKSWAAWIFLGLAFLFHPISALFMAAFMGIHLLTDSSRRAHGKEWLAILGFVMLSAPVFIKKFTAPDTGFPGFWADPYWMETIRIRSAHHSFPDSWSLSQLLSGLGLWSILIAGTFFGRKAKWQPFLLAISLGLVLIFSAGILFTYVWPAFTAMQVQPFRASRLMMILALLFIPILFSSAKDVKQPFLFWVALAIFLLASAWLQSVLHLLWYALMLSIIAIDELLPKFRKSIPVILMLIFLLIMPLRHPQRPELGAVAPKEQQELYQWIRSNTSQQSLWVIPGDMMYFRNFTGRSALVAWWDGTFGYFDYRYNRDWRRRYKAVFGELDARRTEPQISDPAMMESLTREFDPEQLYLLKRKPLTSEDFLEVWKNDSFYVYTPVR